MLRLCRIHLAPALAGAVFAAALTFSDRCFAGDAAADALVNTGVDRYKRHDYQGARDAFARAYAIDPSEVGTLFNLALAELQSGHPIDAARHLRTYVASPQAQAERLESARSKWLPEAEAQIGRVSIDAPAGTNVSVDGTAAGAAPFEQPIYVAAGEHVLTAKLSSGERTMHVSAAAGGIVSVRFVPEEAPTPVVPASPPPALVAPPSKLPETDEAPPPARATTQGAKIATVTALGGTAIVATGIAIGFGVASQSAENRANGLRGSLPSTSACAPAQPSSPPTCAQLQSAVNEQNQDYKLQIGFYAAGGALAAAAVTTWLLWPHSSSQSSWSIQPAFVARSASALVSGSF